MIDSQMTDLSQSKNSNPLEIQLEQLNINKETFSHKQMATVRNT